MSIKHTQSYINDLIGQYADIRTKIVKAFEEKQELDFGIGQYTDIRTKIVKSFEEKQELNFGIDKVGLNESYFWNDFYLFSFEDIVLDLSSNQEAGVIKDWFNSCNDTEPTINYNSYCMGLRHEDLKKNEK